MFEGKLEATVKYVIYYCNCRQYWSILAGSDEEGVCHSLGVTTTWLNFPNRTLINIGNNYE